MGDAVAFFAGLVIFVVVVMVAAYGYGYVEERWKRRRDG